MNILYSLTVRCDRFGPMLKCGRLEHDKIYLLRIEFPSTLKPYLSLDYSLIRGSGTCSQIEPAFSLLPGSWVTVLLLLTFYGPSSHAWCVNFRSLIICSSTPTSSLFSSSYISGLLIGSIVWDGSQEGSQVHSNGLWRVFSCFNLCAIVDVSHNSKLLLPCYSPTISYLQRCDDSFEILRRLVSPSEELNTLLQCLRLLHAPIRQECVDSLVFCASSWTSNQSFRNLWHYGNMTTGTGCCPSIFCWVSPGLSNCKLHHLRIGLLSFVPQGNTFGRLYYSPQILFTYWLQVKRAGILALSSSSRPRKATMVLQLGI